MINLNTFRKFNPKFSKIANNKLQYYLSSNLENKKKQYNLILSLGDFKQKYPDFDLNYYILFNNDLYSTFKNFNEFYIHYINYGVNENRIISEKSFLNKYANYNETFFREINEDLIDINLGNINLEKFRIKLDDKFKLKKLYSTEYEKYKNKEETNFILDIIFFNKFYPDIDLEIISLFNKNILGELLCDINDITIQKNIKLIKFYLENKNKNTNKINYIFSLGDFDKKYVNFNYDFFIKFHNLNLDEMEAKIYYNNKIENNINLICNPDCLELEDFSHEIKIEQFD